MRTSIATVGLGGDLREKLAAIAGAGFDGIEIFEQDFVAHDGSPADVGRMVRDHGLEILLFQPFRDFEGLPELGRSRALDRAEHKLDLMGELGCGLMLVCSSIHPEARGGVSRAADDLRELGERAVVRGLRVGYETLAWGRHVADHRDAWEVVRRADHPAVGLILDSFHTLARGTDPETTRAIPGDRVFFVQLADAPGVEMDLLHRSLHFRCMLGEGELPVGAFMQAVAATGYDGPVSLEVFDDQFRDAPARAVAADGNRSLLALMDDVARAELASALAPAPMPPRARPLGVESVEFATTEAEAAPIAAMLRIMGFARSATHRSERVELWTQGAIRIVLDTEVEGFARNFHLTHGTGVSDMGLRVPDAATAVERARRLGSAPFRQPVGPGEGDIPAIRGVGGSVPRFLDETTAARVWEVELDPVEHGTAGAGLTRIDHLAQTMRYDEMLSRTSFHTVILDMRKTPTVDVIDPDGLTRSQAVESADGALRLTLNGAETHRTLAGGFLADSFGSPVQHIALATDDLIATARALAAAGFPALPIPANYHDDLGKRFELDPDDLAAMRAANALYDRGEGGEHLQLYSRPSAGGLFFEIVERRGAYAGYGAPNAPFRIAAQKRPTHPKGMPRVRGVA